MFGSAQRGFVLKFTKELSTCKDFGFKDQITRSSLSIPSNIAEGFEGAATKIPANSFIMQKAPPVNYAPKFTLASKLATFQKKQVFPGKTKQNKFQRCWQA